jgi:hypothetical protein
LRGQLRRIEPAAPVRTGIAEPLDDQDRQQGNGRGGQHPPQQDGGPADRVGVGNNHLNLTLT